MFMDKISHTYNTIRKLDVNEIMFMDQINQMDEMILRRWILTIWIKLKFWSGNHNTNTQMLLITQIKLF
jgi:hypothetical protein